MAADLEDFGVSFDTIGIERQSERFEVWPENWDSVIAFLACETQWRCAVTLTGLIMTGIVYADADVILRRFQSPDHVFHDLRTMERAALAVFKEAR